MGEVVEIVADNNSEHDEILDAAIMYKTDGTAYPSNSWKDWKRAIRKRAERLEIVKGELERMESRKSKPSLIQKTEQKRILEDFVI